MSNQNDIEVLLRRESVASAIINGIGAFMTFFYLNVIDPEPKTGKSITAPENFASFVFIVILITFIFIGLSWGNRLKKNFKKWYYLVQTGETAAADVPEKIKRDLLNFPFYATGIAAIMWLSASIMAAYATESSRVFFSLLGWGGIIATTLLYFVEELLWRPIIPVFFPDGNLSKVKALHLPIFWKLLIAFFFIGILPPALLARLTWQRVNTLFVVSNAEILLENLLILQIFILGASVTASIGLALFITYSITDPIEMLSKAIKLVQKDDLNAKVLVTTSDELGYLGEHFNQMTAELRLKEKLRQQAIRDPLTGLFNRRYMIETLEQELLRASRHESDLSIVMIDLDDLKQINDTHGHIDGGDRALKVLANTLKELCRQEDTICRYAGDEFVVILYETSAKDAHERTLEWQEAIAEQKIMVADKEIKIAFSAGVVEYPSRSISAEELLQYADLALYQAKEDGRNRVVIYTSAQESTA